MDCSLIGILDKLTELSNIGLVIGLLVIQGWGPSSVGFSGGLT